MGLCDNCPNRGDCDAPCEGMQHSLDSPDRGRPPRLAADGARAAETVVTAARRLAPRDQAIAHLYYRSGFSLQRIGDAFGLHRSTVHRALLRCRRGTMAPRECVAVEGTP